MPKCSQKGCEEPACYCYVWHDYQYCCAEHMLSILSIAGAMGFPTPINTMRLLAPEEMIAAEGETSDA